MLISAAEPSGFVLARLVGRRLEGHAEVRLLEAARKLGPVLGFVEGVVSAGRARSALAAAREESLSPKPAVALLIACPGFHLPLGRWLRSRGVVVVLLGPPQFWAWGGWRVHQLVDSADRIVCFFRFEQEWLRRAGVEADYFGYPFLDDIAVDEVRRRTLVRLGLPADAQYVAFLPGSRPAELRFHLSLFERVADMLGAALPGVRTVMVAEPGATPKMPCTREGRHAVMAHSACAAVCSGTATAECAVVDTPMVATYHLSRLSRVLARGLVRTPFFALPNIIAGRHIVPELLEPTAASLSGALSRLLSDPALRAGQRAAFEVVRERLGPAGATERIAELVLRCGGQLP